ncbi:MAG: VOC family protein [Acidimicrobiia bacterium]|nr:VOC family protein [Acidimicrobiia bacterium]
MAGLPVDHIVYAARDLPAAVEDLAAQLGVRAAPGGQHVGRGTRNFLLSLGDGPYLEVIGPDPDQPEPPAARPFGVDTLAADHLVGFAVKCADIPGAVARSRAGGYDPGDEHEMARATPDGALLEWKLTLGPGFDGLVPFLIDWMATPHPSATNPGGATLVGLRGEHPEPAGVRAALDALGVELDVAEGPAPALVATLDTPRGRVELR